MSTARPSPANGTRQAPLPPGAGTNGWLTFAGIVLFLNGCFAALYGLALILNDDVVTVGGGKGVVIWDATAWGWITLVVGVAMALTGVGLFTGNTAARMLAVAFIVLHALVQFGTLTVFPLWSILMIALDVVILYQLVARWQPIE
jgi:hypothetical protein